MRPDIFPFLAITLVFTTTTSTFAVYNLQALGEDNPSLLNISYSIANFGFVPYGKTIIARLMASPNFSSECIVDPGEAASYGKPDFMQKIVSCWSREESANSWRRPWMRSEWAHSWQWSWTIKSTSN